MNQILLAGVVSIFSMSAAWADGHAIVPDQAEPALYEPAAAESYRETCEQMDWGFDGVRTECRYEPLPVRRANPALKGICTIYYGERTCY